MKFKHQVSLYAGGAGMTTLAAILLSVREQLIMVGPWVLDTMLVSAGVALLYGGFRVYVSGRSHWLTIRTRENEVKAQEQDLRIGAERWTVERAALLLGQHLQAARIYPDSKGYMPTVVNMVPDGYQFVSLPHPAHTRIAAAPRPVSLPEQADSLHDEAEPVRELPTNVRYEEIRHLVPHGHVLVGVGYEGVETKPQAVGACVWIVGLSGTGKTSTTVLRVEERAADNHVFLGVDPHFFKDDSLYHAIYETLDGVPGPYANRFLMPMAKTPAESLQVYKAFLNEFNARKSGQRPKPWPKITLLSDEVGAQMDKATATTPEEKEIIELLPSIARICGQEARNFMMGGMFISQQATGLAWLRKVALMIIVHQLLMESEKKIACNEDPEVMRDMKYWPIGRTYVFGVGFGIEGPRTVQQPYFKPAEAGNSGEMEPLQPKRVNTSPTLIDFQAEQWKRAGNGREAAQEKAGKDTDELNEENAVTLKKMLQDIREKRAGGTPLNTILREYGINGGRAHQEMKQLLDEMEA